MTDREVLDILHRAYAAGFELRHRHSHYYWASTGQEIEGTRASTLHEAAQVGDRALRQAIRLVNWYEIAGSDIGRHTIEAFGRKWDVQDFMGRIMPRDVGKRVYRTRTNDRMGYVLQVENDEQFAARLAAASA